MGVWLMNGKARTNDNDQFGRCAWCRLEEDRQLAEAQNEEHGGYADDAVSDDDSDEAAVPCEEVPDTFEGYGGGYRLRRQSAQSVLDPAGAGALRARSGPGLAQPPEAAADGSDTEDADEAAAAGPAAATPGSGRSSRCCSGSRSKCGLMDGHRVARKAERARMAAKKRAESARAAAEPPQAAVPPQAATVPNRAAAAPQAVAAEDGSDADDSDEAAVPPEMSVVPAAANAAPVRHVRAADAEARQEAAQPAQSALAATPLERFLQNNRRLLAAAEPAQAAAGIPAAASAAAIPAAAAAIPAAAAAILK